MKLRVIIISLFLLKCVSSAGQIVPGDSLLFYEYAYFKTSNDSVKQNYLLRKVSLYLNNNVTSGEALREIKRVRYTLISNDSSRVAFLWNASLVSYLNDEIPYAKNYLEQYRKTQRDSSMQTILLSLLINKNNDTSAAVNDLNFLARKDILFSDLSCLKDVLNYEKKHQALYMIASAIIPGAGTIASGYLLKGLTSLAIVSASAYGVIKLVEYGLYINSVLWGAGLGLKFYFGNILLTKKMFDRSEQKKKTQLNNACEMKLKRVLEKYPISLKAL